MTVFAHAGFCSAHAANRAMQQGTYQRQVLSDALSMSHVPTEQSVIAFEVLQYQNKHKVTMVVSLPPCCAFVCYTISTDYPHADLPDQHTPPCHVSECANVKYTSSAVQYRSVALEEMQAGNEVCHSAPATPLYSSCS